MATILPFGDHHSVFEPETTHAMSVAFDEVCLILNLTEGSLKEAIAAKIIQLARQGKRDSMSLRENTLNEISWTTDSLLKRAV
jgi:hypothetical protein